MKMLILLVAAVAAYGQGLIPSPFVSGSGGGGGGSCNPSGSAGEVIFYDGMGCDTSSLFTWDGSTFTAVGFSRLGQNGPSFNTDYNFNNLPNTPVVSYTIFTSGSTASDGAVESMASRLRVESMPAGTFAFNSFEGVAEGRGTASYSVMNGVVGNAFTFDSANITTALNGFLGFSEVIGTGTVAKMRGGYAGVANDAGTVTDAIGLETEAYIYSTTTNLYGLKVAAPDVTPGTLTNQYGLFVADMTAATNNWAIKTGAGNVDLGTLTSTGSAGGKKVVCVDTANGRLYASSTGTDCSN